MNWINHHAVLIALVCSCVAIAYGIYLTFWLLKLSPGNERMQEISRAVQEGAAAYLKKQYTHHRPRRDRALPPDRRLQRARLGDGDRIPDRRDALCRRRLHRHERRPCASNARTAEAARGGLGPALNVAFSAGSVTGLLVVGLGLFGVAGYYWVLTRPASTTRPSRRSGDLDRPRVRRLADLGLRATRRRHLHEGGRRRRRPGREDRGGHPRGRPAQPGRDRGQRRRQRRRLRRHGGRPVRDLRRHGRRRACCSGQPRVRRRRPEALPLPARARRHLDPRLDDRHASSRASAAARTP